jgi:lipoprotein-releasing system permease protein
LVATSGVAVGVGFFLAVSAMMVGSQADLVRTLINSAPHITVRDEARNAPQQPAVAAFPGGAVEVHGLRARDEVRGLKDWSAMLAAARAVKGVTATPALIGGVTVSFAGRTEALALSGIDPRIENLILDIEKDLIGGTLADLEYSPNGMIVSTQVATRLGARLGDTLIVASAAGITQRGRIVALLNSDRRTGSGDLAYALLRTAQVLFGRPNIVNQLHLRLSDPQMAQVMAAQFEARWPYKWESWQERSRDILDTLVVRNVIMYAVISAILLVASFGVYTLISTNVSEKRRDIAILRAIGFSEVDITGIFLIEGVALGMLGAIIGFALGLGLMQVLAAVPFHFSGQTYFIPIDRGIGQFAIAGGVSLGSAVFAAWLPARRAAMADPVDILRGAA